MSRPTVAVLFYKEFEHEGASGHIAPHAMPVRFEREAAEYIRATYRQEPREVVHGHGVTLDPGGMVMVKTPFVITRLRGYTTRCKLDHASFVHEFLRRRLSDNHRVRWYGGEETMTIHGLALSLVLPLADIPKIIRSLERHLVDSEMALVKRDRDLSKIPGVLVRGKR